MNAEWSDLAPNAAARGWGIIDKIPERRRELQALWIFSTLIVLCAVIFSLPPAAAFLVPRCDILSILSQPKRRLVGDHWAGQRLSMFGLSSRINEGPNMGVIVKVTHQLMLFHFRPTNRTNAIIDPEEEECCVTKMRNKPHYTEICVRCNGATSAWNSNDVGR